MTRMELMPLRPWGDFFPGSERFARPDGKDLAKWNKRVINNLLYYQTNYLALVTAVLLIVGVVKPLETITAIGVVSIVFVVSVWAGENKATINNFKKQKPSAFVILVVVASCIFVSMLGSVMVFIWAITVPLILIFAHASCRLRNMKNKLEHMIDSSGLKKSFMGSLLDSLGQQEETSHKIHNFLDGQNN